MATLDVVHENKQLNEEEPVLKKLKKQHGHKDLGPFGLRRRAEIPASSTNWSIHIRETIILTS